jgi:hypothetical protein
MQDFDLLHPWSLKPDTTGKAPMPNHNTKNRGVNPIEAKTFTVTLSRLANTPPPDRGRAHRAQPVAGVAHVY